MSKKDDHTTDARFVVVTTKEVRRYFKTEEAAQTFVGNLNFGYYDLVEIEQLEEFHRDFVKW